MPLYTIPISLLQALESILCGPRLLRSPLLRAHTSFARGGSGGGSAAAAVVPVVPFRWRRLLSRTTNNGKRPIPPMFSAFELFAHGGAAATSVAAAVGGLDRRARRTAEHAPRNGGSGSGAAAVVSAPGILSTVLAMVQNVLGSAALLSDEVGGWSCRGLGSKGRKR